LVLAFIGIIAVVSIAAGLYPAMLLSSFRPVQALRENVKGSWHHLLLKKGLVVFQFTIAISLIIGTTVVYRQLQYIQNRNIGLDKEQVVQLELPLIDQGKGKRLQSELSKNPRVLSTTLTAFSYSYGISRVAILPEGANENELTSLPVIAVDENFLTTFKIPLITGRNFSSSFPSDSAQAFMLNETAAKYFGWTAQSALGKGIDWGLGKKGKVVGVVKDFNFNSLHENIEPLILHIDQESYGNLSVRIQPGQTLQTIKEMEASWKSAGAVSSMKYTFLDEDFLSLYKADQKMQSILGVFTILSIFIACLGIFGLTAYTIRQRFKEIGVRKVLGAGSGNIVWLFSKEFMSLLVLSIILASSAAWIFMNKWLEDFAYHINLSIWVFILAGLLTLTISFLTVGLLAFKASLANPARNLRME
jgi:putative ABC transport system permease protein